jgi:RNA polymerase sigma-70 factor, ECF subfamily
MRAAFLEGVGEAARERMAAMAQGGLCEALAQAYARGRTAWPDVELDPVVFAADLGRRFAEAPDPGRAVEERIVEDVYLAVACTIGDARALRAFERSFAGILDRRSAAVDHDVGQETRTRLLVARPGHAARIAGYAGEGRLVSWVRVVAARVRADHERGRALPCAAEADAWERVIDADPSPELVHLRTLYRTHFAESLRAAVASLDPSERNLLRQRHVYRVATPDIARMEGLHPASVRRRLVRVRELVVERTRDELRRRLGTVEIEIESMLRLVRSGLDLSLPGLLAPTR